jgi:hypothetical protein
MCSECAQRTIRSLGFHPNGPILARAFNLANQNPFFRLALVDFLRAINDVLDCPTYCYRAIESIKSAFVRKTGLDGWDECTLRSALTKS